MKLINKIVIPFVLFALVFLASITIFFQRSLQGALVKNEYLNIRESVASEAATHLLETDFSPPQDPGSQQRFLAFSQGVTDVTTARITVWNENGDIIYSDLAPLIGQHAVVPPEIVAAYSQGKASYVVRTKDNGKPVQSDVGSFVDVFVPVFFGEKIVGVVEVRSVMGSVLGPVSQQVDLISLLLVLGTFLLIFVFFLMAQLFIGRPMRKIDAFVAAIEKGNLDARVDISSKDEIGQLGRELNRMADGLRRLEELKNEFVFIASHELRSPVTGIKGYLSLFKDSGEDKKLSDEARGYLENVGKANERVVQLIDDILDIARSEAGKMRFDLEPCDLTATVEKLIQEQAAVASAKKISVAYARKSKLPSVLADDGRLKEVVANLLSNAIKYTPAGGSVVISHEVAAGRVVTHVQDTGYGMSPDEQKRLFEKFFRSEKIRTKGIIGTGLGLFITKQLVEKMRGKIWVKSEEEKGSTFSFSLRVAAKGRGGGTK